MTKERIMSLVVSLTCGVILGACQTVVTPDDQNDGTAPEVMAVEFYEVNEAATERIPMKRFSFDLGEEAVMFVLARDPDRNMETLRYTQTQVPTGNSDSLQFDLPVQTGDELAYPIEVPIAGPVGEWQADFYITDSEGNESDTKSYTITINDR